MCVCTCTKLIRIQCSTAENGDCFQINGKEKSFCLVKRVLCSRFLLQMYSTVRDCVKFYAYVVTSCVYCCDKLYICVCVCGHWQWFVFKLVYRFMCSCVHDCSKCFADDAFTIDAKYHIWDWSLTLYLSVLSEFKCCREKTRLASFSQCKYSNYILQWDWILMIRE